MIVLASKFIQGGGNVDNRELIQAGLDYIENNLKSDIAVQELAYSAGFSLFHYYRLFQKFVGIPVQQYIIRRRLLNAIFEIGSGRKMIDTAYDYGFDSYAGFYKAFRREFGCSPTTYLKCHRAKKPYRIDLFQEEQIMMTHKRITRILAAWNMDNADITDIYYDGTDRKNEHAYYIGTDHVLKISANIGELKNHIDISKALHAVGINAAIPITTTENTEILQNGELYACLTKRLTGSPLLSKDLYQDTSGELSRFLGRSLAKMHMALRDLDDIAAKDNNLLSLIKEIALPQSKDILKMDDNFCSAFLKIFEELYPLLPRQLIHRDAHPGNILIQDGLAGFVDFDLSERNLRLYDICYAATAVLSDCFFDNSFQPESWLNIYRWIIAGYNDVQSLIAAERKAAPYVLLANQFVCVSWFSQQAQYEDVFKTNVAMTRWLVEHFKELIIL